MKKYYYCTLKQVSEEQGYIWGAIEDRITKSLVFDVPSYYALSDRERNKLENLKFPKRLIVEKTPNRQFLREIKTGMLIPVLRAKHQRQFNQTRFDEDLSDWYYHEYDFSSFNKPVNTFVALIKNETFGRWGWTYDKDGLDEIDNAQSVQSYLDNIKDKEAFERQLLDFFAEGKAKQQRKCQLQKEGKIEAEENKKQMKDIQRQLKRR